MLDPTTARITRQVYKETSVWMLKDIMTNYTSAATLSVQMGGKTGTNSNWTGVTFAGFTAYYTCAVWIGHDNYKPLARGTTGASAAAPLWKRVMQPIHQGLENRPIQTNSAGGLGLVQATVCGVSGKLCNDACRADGQYPPRTDYYVPGTHADGDLYDAHGRAPLLRLRKDRGRLLPRFRRGGLGNRQPRKHALRRAGEILRHGRGSRYRRRFRLHAVPYGGMGFVL